MQACSVKTFPNLPYSLFSTIVRKHIVETDKQAKRRFEIIMKQMLEKNPIDENLKNTDPLKWTGFMNNYKYSVEEIIFNRYINC